MQGNPGTGKEASHPPAAQGPSNPGHALAAPHTPPPTRAWISWPCRAGVKSRMVSSQPRGGTVSEGPRASYPGPNGASEGLPAPAAVPCGAPPGLALRAPLLPRESVPGPPRDDGLGGGLLVGLRRARAPALPLAVLDGRGSECAPASWSALLLPSPASSERERCTTWPLPAGGSSPSLEVAASAAGSGATLGVASAAPPAVPAAAACRASCARCTSRTRRSSCE